MIMIVYHMMMFVLVQHFHEYNLFHFVSYFFFFFKYMLFYLAGAAAAGAATLADFRDDRR